MEANFASRKLAPVLLIALCVCSLDLYAGSQRKLVEHAAERAVFVEGLGHLAILPTSEGFSTDQLPRVHKIAAKTPCVTLVVDPSESVEGFAAYLSDPAAVPRCRELLAANLGQAGLPVMVRPGPAQSRYYREVAEQSAGKLQAMLVGVLLAVCAVMLLAATASARERLRERAMVRALDGSPRGLFGHVVAEAFLVALAGGVLGLVASTTFNWVDKFMASEWNLTLELDPARQLGALASVLLVSLLAALWPAWKASTVNVAGQIAELPDRAA